MDFTLISFIALSMTGFFIASFGSLGVWFLCAFMSLTRWLLLLPLGIGAFIVYGAVILFYSRI